MKKFPKLKAVLDAAGDIDVRTGHGGFLVATAFGALWSHEPAVRTRAFATLFARSPELFELLAELDAQAAPGPEGCTAAVVRKCFFERVRKVVDQVRAAMRPEPKPRRKR